MKTCATAIAAAMVLTTIAGCKINLTSEAYSTDLFEAASGTAGVTTPATTALQVPGADECDKRTTDIATIMTGVVNEFSPKECESIDMDSFLLADTQIPLLISEAAWDDADALFGIIVVSEDNDIGASLVMNLDKYGILTRQMKDKFRQGVDLGKSKITIKLHNDSRNPVVFSVGAPLSMASWCWPKPSTS